MKQGEEKERKGQMGVQIGTGLRGEGGIAVAGVGGQRLGQGPAPRGFPGQPRTRTGRRQHHQGEGGRQRD